MLCRDMLKPKTYEPNRWDFPKGDDACSLLCGLRTALHCRWEKKSCKQGTDVRRYRVPSMCRGCYATKPAQKASVHYLCAFRSLPARLRAAVETIRLGRGLGSGARFCQWGQGQVGSARPAQDRTSLAGLLHSRLHPFFFADWEPDKIQLVLLDWPPYSRLSLPWSAIPSPVLPSGRGSSQADGPYAQGT